VCPSWLAFAPRKSSIGHRGTEKKGEKKVGKSEVDKRE
jgi:hypothetical protein